MIIPIIKISEMVKIAEGNLIAVFILGFQETDSGSFKTSCF